MTAFRKLAALYKLATYTLVVTASAALAAHAGFYGTPATLDVTVIG